MPTDEQFQQIMRLVQHQQDRQDIVDCIVRESRSRDRQDSAMIASCWWDEGMDEHGATITNAPEYPARANAGHAANFNLTSHNITNHLCEIDRNTAYCESYVVGGLFWLDGKTTTIVMGRYIDQLEKRNGQWRLLKRRCTIEMSADADATWVYSQNVKGFLKGLWSKEDPSYERPIVPKIKSEGVRW
jgi:hypothetical protein